MLVLLVGPKGSGKSHIGRLLEAHLGVRFFHVEPLWMAYHAECRAAGRPPVLAEGIARVHPRIAQALREHEHVCIETTGASPEILVDLLSLAPEPERLVARVEAPLELCLERIVSRNPTHQIPMDLEGVRQVHALSESLALRADLVVENSDLPEAEILARFREALNPF